MRTNGKATRDDERETRRSYDSGGGSRVLPFLAGAVLGAIVGATVALLYAPAEGSELRRGLSDTLDDVTEGAKEILRTAKTTAEKMFSEGRGEVDEIIDSTRERANDILEDADRAIAEAKRRSKDWDREEDEE